jgi:thiol-disulfide isomerase/thioredoxin
MIRTCSITSAIAIFFTIWISPSGLFAQNTWTEGEVTIQGTILNYKEGETEKTVSFFVADLIDRSVRKTYTAEANQTGHFEIKIPILYPQDFYVNYNSLATLICAPGDKLVFDLDTTKKKQASVSVTGGNRVKDNVDYSAFLGGLALMADRNLDDQSPGLPAMEYQSYVKSRDKKYVNFLTEFKRKNKTSEFFNGLAEDHIRYGTWESLLRYRLDHSVIKKVKRDSIKIPAEYFSFLKEYDMDDDQRITLRHAAFLHELNMYTKRTPADSLKKASLFFKSDQIISGANVLINMIELNSSGFTRDLFLTKFYFDALEGQQLREFEVLYKPGSISHPYFKKLIGNNHEKLKKFMANQETGEANIQAINGSAAKSLIDTLIAKYSGKVIYMDFWAPWCSPCMEEMPASKVLQDTYKDGKVIFLFLGNQCEASSWKATIANKKLTGEHILLTRDQFNVLAAEFGISGIPHYVLIDKKGNIVNKNAVRPRDPDLKKQLNNLLN